MGKPKSFEITTLPYKHSGILIEYTRSRRALYISGWYDSFVGIQGQEKSLREFFFELGITLKDCQKAFVEEEKRCQKLQSS